MNCPGTGHERRAQRGPGAQAESYQGILREPTVSFPSNWWSACGSLEFGGYSDRLFVALYENQGFKHQTTNSNHHLGSDDLNAVRLKQLSSLGQWSKWSRQCRGVSCSGGTAHGPSNGKWSSPPIHQHGICLEAPTRLYFS